MSCSRAWASAWRCCGAPSTSRRFESLTDSELSGPNREQLDALLDTLNGQLVSGIADARKLSPEVVQQLIDRGPLTADDALSAGLIDVLRYHDESLKFALRRAGPEAATVPLADVCRRGVASRTGRRQGRPDPRGRPDPARRRAARRPRSRPTSLPATLEDVAGDPELNAVVLRLDSGGGSAVASETIRRALLQARAAGKPVIVSMSNTAASGGYWIAMGADRIVAQPATLTGSIGVIAGKPVLEEAWRKLGVNWAEITRGASAGMWSINQPLLGRGPRPGRRAGRLALRPLHQAGLERATLPPGSRGRDRARARLGRRDGAQPGAGRRARRLRRGAGGRPQPP